MFAPTKLQKLRARDNLHPGNDVVVYRLNERKTEEDKVTSTNRNKEMREKEKPCCTILLCFRVLLYIMHLQVTGRYSHDGHDSHRASPALIVAIATVPPYHS